MSFTEITQNFHFTEVYTQPPPTEYQQLPPVMQQPPPQQPHPDYPAVPQPVPAAAAPTLMPPGTEAFSPFGMVCQLPKGFSHWSTPTPVVWYYAKVFALHQVRFAFGQCD